MADTPTLRRSLSLSLLTLYGLGTTIGAGVYVLIGAVAGSAGGAAPFAFLFAAALVGFSALAFAELSARMPRSAGEAIYVFAGFGSERLAQITGLCVILAGLVSAATISHGFVGYLQSLWPVPYLLALAAVVVVLGAIAAWGIRESVGLAAVITVIEIAGLIYVLWVGRGHLADFPARWQEFIPAAELPALLGILSGGVIAFYAFIGFEDMVNVAEEVRDVRRTLPKAIVLTLVATTVLYLAVAVVGVLAVPLPELAGSKAPVALIVERGGGRHADLLSLVALIAVLNGALIQVIMASRVAYGLAQRGWLPTALGRIHARRRTPVLATAAATVLVLLFALTMPLETLARATSLITLGIFATVNMALWRIKGREPEPPADGVCYPRWISLIGAVACLAVIVSEVSRLTLP